MDYIDIDDRLMLLCFPLDQDMYHDELTMLNRHYVEYSNYVTYHT